MLLVAAGLTAALTAGSVALSWAIEDGLSVGSWTPWTIALLAFALLGIPPWLLLPGRRVLFLLRRHRRKNLPSKEAAEQPPAVRHAEADPADPAESRDETPRWRLSRALPIALTLIATGLWLGSFAMVYYNVERNAGSNEGFFAPAMRVAKHQLALRSVSIRRFVAANGRLPRSLNECDTDQRLLDMILFSRKNPKALPGFNPPIFEPWAPNPYVNDKRTLTAQPPTEMDYLGLPLLYQPGKSRDERKGWIDESSSLPEPVHRYIELQGHGVPPRSKLPYALSSVFVQWNIKTQQDHRREVSNVRALQLGGLAGLLCGCLFVVVIWRGKPLRWFSWIGVAASAAFAVLFFTGALAAQSTCYSMSSFMSSRLKRHDRLAILEQAVAAGDVPEEVAAKARQFINDLPTAEQ